MLLPDINALDVTEEKPKHVMRVMDMSGDTKIMWDSDKPDEVAAAKETFKKLKAKGYHAYAVKKNGDQGDLVNEFDPEAEKIILAPPIAGG